MTQRTHLTPKDEQLIRDRFKATAAPEPDAGALRAQIAQALRENEKLMAQQDQLGGADPSEVSRALKVGRPPPQPAVGAPGFTPGGRNVDPGETGAPLAQPKPTTAIPKGYTPPGAAGTGVVDTAGDPKRGRAALNTISGGATEAVIGAVQGAEGQAGREIQAKELNINSPEAAAIFAAAQPGQSVTLVRTPGGWIPSTSTSASGATGKDPESRAEALRQQALAEERDIRGLEFQQDAERAQTNRLQQVQQNEMEAISEFKRANDELDDRYQKERQTQVEKLKGIQTAMEAVPDAPRTIGQKLARAGVEDKIRYGLAAAFSIFGGAAMKDGGKSTNNLLGIMQANVDREVQKEADEFARLGERFKSADNIYSKVREGVQDDRAALNITKALYYDAAMNTVQQIANQYKMDMQAPQIQSLLAHLARERQKLVLDSAATVQEQISQTDKFIPPGVAAIGGSKSGAGDDEETAKALEKYGLEAEKRGINSDERAVALYQRALAKMQGSGFGNDEKFWGAFVAMNSGDSMAARVAVNMLPREQQEVLQDLFTAGQAQITNDAGKTLTGNELAMQTVRKGGFSPAGIDQVRRQLIEGRDRKYRDIDGTFGGPPDPRGGSRFGNVYRSRKLWSSYTGPNKGLGADPGQPLDRDEVGGGPQGKLSQ